MRGYFNKSIIGLSFFSFLLLLFSCGKNCNIENVGPIDSGSIIANSQIKASCGYLMVSQPDSLLITAVHPYANRLTCSMGGGEYTPVDFANYSVISYPMFVNQCVSIDRKVTIDNTLQTVTYKIIITQCGDSPESVYLENFVLIPKVDGYQGIYEVEYNNI